MWAKSWLLFFFGVNAAIAWYDFRQRRVPNRLLLWAFCLQTAWLLAHMTELPALPPHWQDLIVTRWSPALTGAAVALFFLFPLWRFRAMGAGDVKFAACLGFCTGLLGLSQALLIATALAAAHSLAYYAQRLCLTGARRFGLPSVPESTPYAAYLAIGTLIGLGWQLLHGQPWLYNLMGKA